MGEFVGGDEGGEGFVGVFLHVCAQSVKLVAVGNGGGLTIHPPVRMHSAMPEILPAIAEEDRDAEPRRRLQNPIHHLRNPDLPRRKPLARRGEEKRLQRRCRHARRANDTDSATKGASIAFQRLANGPHVDAHGRQNQRDGSARSTDPASPDRNIVFLPSGKIPGVRQIANRQPQRGLNRLLHKYGTQNLAGGDAVALLEFRRRVEAVLGEVVLCRNNVEDEGHEPVGCDGEEEGEVEVGDVGEERGLGVECVWGERGKGGSLVEHGDCRLGLHVLWEGGRWGSAREGWKEVGRILYNLSNFWFRMKGLLIRFESW